VLFSFPSLSQSREIEHDAPVTPGAVVSWNSMRPPTITPVPTSTTPPYPTPEAMTGYFSQYGKMPTDGTVAYRLDVGDFTQEDLDDAAGVIATESCDYIGDDAWIRVDGKTGNWLPVLVFDCSGHQETTDWMKESNILAEIGYYLADQLGIVGETGVTGQLTFDCPHCER